MAGICGICKIHIYYTLWFNVVRMIEPMNRFSHTYAHSNRNETLWWWWWWCRRVWIACDRQTLIHLLPNCEAVNVWKLIYIMHLYDNDNMSRRVQRLTLYATLRKTQSICRISILSSQSFSSSSVMFVVHYIYCQSITLNGIKRWPKFMLIWLSTIEREFTHKWVRNVLRSSKKCIYNFKSAC